MEEAPSDTDVSIRFLDGVKYQQNRFLGYFSGNIEAYYYPSGFHEDVFTRKRVRSFGLSYRTGTAKNYRIHLVYNVTVSPPTHIYQQGETDPFRWLFTSLPVEIPGFNRSAHLIIDVATAYASTVSDLEDVLYGTEETDPRLPTPEEVLAIFEENSILKVTDHGDGSFTVTGPDSAITMIDSTTFEITWPSVVLIDSDTYQISSL